VPGVGEHPHIGARQRLLQCPGAAWRRQAIVVAEHQQCRAAHRGCTLQTLHERVAGIHVGVQHAGARAFEQAQRGPDHPDAGIAVAAVLVALAVTPLGQHVEGGVPIGPRVLE